MASNLAQSRDGGLGDAKPMQIATHSGLSAKEKLDWLHEMKAEVSISMQPGFSPQEVDDAINQVKLDAREGEELKTVIWGDH